MMHEKESHTTDSLHSFKEHTIHTTRNQLRQLKEEIGISGWYSFLKNHPEQKDYVKKICFFLKNIEPTIEAENVGDDETSLAHMLEKIFREIEYLSQKLEKNPKETAKIIFNRCGFHGIQKEILPLLQTFPASIPSSSKHHISKAHELFFKSKEIFFEEVKSIVKKHKYNRETFHEEFLAFFLSWNKKDYVSSEDIYFLAEDIFENIEYNNTLSPTQIETIQEQAIGDYKQTPKEEQAIANIEGYIQKILLETPLYDTKQNQNESYSEKNIKARISKLSLEDIKHLISSIKKEKEFIKQNKIYLFQNTTNNPISLTELLHALHTQSKEKQNHILQEKISHFIIQKIQKKYAHLSGPSQEHVSLEKKKEIHAIEEIFQKLQNIEHIADGIGIINTILPSYELPPLGEDDKNAIIEIIHIALEVKKDSIDLQNINLATESSLQKQQKSDIQKQIDELSLVKQVSIKILEKFFEKIRKGEPPKEAWKKIIEETEKTKNQKPTTNKKKSPIPKNTKEKKTFSNTTIRFYQNGTNTYTLLYRHNESTKRIPLTLQEFQQAQHSQEACTNIILFYHTLEKLNLTSLWKYRYDIFQVIKNKHSIVFDWNDNYLTKKEIQLFLIYFCRSLSIPVSLEHEQYSLIPIIKTYSTLLKNHPLLKNETGENENPLYILFRKLYDPNNTGTIFHYKFSQNI